MLESLATACSLTHTSRHTHTQVVEGRKVYAHRVILSLVSDKFQAMFGSRKGKRCPTTHHLGLTESLYLLYSLVAGFREATQREILVPDKPYSVFVALLEYLYTGQSPPFGRLGDPDHDFAFAVELLKVGWAWRVLLLFFVCTKRVGIFSRLWWW